MGLLFRVVKIADIGYIAAVYTIVASIVLWIIYTLFGKYKKKEDEKKSDLQLSLESLGLMWFVGALVYIVRNIVGDYLPSPFHGIGGFNHYKVKELTSAAIFVFIFAQFFAPLKGKLKILYDRHLDS